MKDVARLAGVSTSTVSHVINKDRFVSETITEKVEAAIKSLNYAPSALARSLKLNQTRTIGMLITASTNPFYSELVRGVERSCFERGYSLVLCNTEGDEQRMNRNLETLMQKRVDGLLLLCTETHQPSREIMERYPSIPTVMMDWSPFDGEGDSDLIQDNSLLGGDLATQYLIDKGFTRIACITGPLDKTPARLRLEGYRAAMKRAGWLFRKAMRSPAILNLAAALTPCRRYSPINSDRKRFLPETMRWLSAPIRRYIRRGFVFRRIWQSLAMMILSWRAI